VRIAGVDILWRCAELTIAAKVWRVIGYAQQNVGVCLMPYLCSILFRFEGMVSVVAMAECLG
jgi:hypothetical protein